MKKVWYDSNMSNEEVFEVSVAPEGERDETSDVSDLEDEDVPVSQDPVADLSEAEAEGEEE